MGAEAFSNRFLLLLLLERKHIINPLKTCALTVRQKLSRTSWLLGEFNGVTSETEVNCLWQTHSQKLRYRRQTMKWPEEGRSAAYKWHFIRVERAPTEGFIDCLHAGGCGCTHEGCLYRNAVVLAAMPYACTFAQNHLCLHLTCRCLEDDTPPHTPRDNC